MTITDGPKIITSRLDHADSHTLKRYVTTGGYDGLRKALAKRPDEVTSEVKTASLLGRGGAGFPAGVKWGFCPPGVWPRYLVVNGDESEPGTYKDRILMERDPHQLIEGILIACYAVGCSQAFLYVRGEMALAQERIAAALNDAYAAGYIGQNIMGTDYSLDIVLHWGAGAYIVGEETALIESLEGNRGMLLDVCDNISPSITWPPKQTTICPLGPSAVSPIASAVTRFRDEFEAKIGGPAPVTVKVNGTAYNSKPLIPVVAAEAAGV